MTQRDAVDVAADALMDKHVAFAWREWRSQRDFRDAIAEALRSASNSGAEAMREAAAECVEKAHRCLSCGAVFDERVPHTDESCSHRYASWEAPSQSDIAAAIRSLPAPGAPASPWRVKKLEWSDHGNRRLVAYSVHGGSYTIRFPDQDHAAFELEEHGHCSHLRRDHPTLEAAKAAAQADFERRIRSAIEPDLPTPPASEDT